MEHFLIPGVAYTPQESGVFMSEDRYRRYRRAISDAILKEQFK